MAAVRITEAELLQALADAAPGDGPEDARTLPEIARETGMNERRVRVALQDMKRAGRLTLHWVRREGLDGRTCSVPAYTIAPATVDHSRALKQSRRPSKRSR